MDSKSSLFDKLVIRDRHGDCREPTAIVRREESVGSALLKLEIKVAVHRFRVGTQPSLNLDCKLSFDDVRRRYRPSLLYPGLPIES